VDDGSRAAMLPRAYVATSIPTAAGLWPRWRRWPSRAGPQSGDERARDTWLTGYLPHKPVDHDRVASLETSKRGGRGL
jgi:hypothetical protein